MKLYLLAHQDDEIFVLSHILESLRQGDDVAVIFVTDGGEHTNRRDRESRVVLERAGVKTERILFLGSRENLPDGALYRNLSKALDLLEKEIALLPPLNLIVTHAWEGGHQDHDCTHALAVILGQSRSIEVHQMPFYREVRRLRNYFAPMWPLDENGEIYWSRWPWPHLLSAVWAMRVYRTQWRTFRWHGPAIFLRRLWCAKTAHQIATPARLLERPHSGRLYYERRFQVQYESVSDALAQLLLSRSSDANVN